MTSPGQFDLADLSMLDLFRIEVENHTKVLDKGLVEAENTRSPETIEPLMRAAHSIKGAARIVGLDLVVSLAHAMEDVLSAAQHGKLKLTSSHIDLLLLGNDILVSLASMDANDIPSWLIQERGMVESLAKTLREAEAGIVIDPSLNGGSHPPHGTPHAALPEMERAKPEAKAAAEEPRPAIETYSIEPVAVKERAVKKETGGQFDLADLSMLDLFRIEVENHTKVLDKGLVEAENTRSPETIEPLMRAAHSIKGAARIVGLDLVVSLAHAMEDVLSAAQHGKLKLTSSHIDLLLLGNDILVSLASMDANDIPSWLIQERGMVESLAKTLREAEAGIVIDPSLNGGSHPPHGTPHAALPEMERAKPEVAEEVPGPAIETYSIEPVAVEEGTVKKETPPEKPLPAEKPKTKGEDVSVRVASLSLNRLIGLAGECLVQANLTKPLYSSLLRAKDVHQELTGEMERVYHSLERRKIGRATRERLVDSLGQMDGLLGLINGHIEEFQIFMRSFERLADKLYSEVQEIKMRPFGDGVVGFPRMIRDLSKELGKKVSFRILGESTRVDRDILEKLEAPLTHLLRNAVDHGLELPEERQKTLKEEEGSLLLEAGHSSGMLHIKVSDDGRGINLEKLRARIVKDGRVSREMASTLAPGELLDFLFLPGFSTAGKVTEVSGRGVGLDVVRSVTEEVGGSVRVETTEGKGTAFHLHLPLTLSVVRGLLVDIGGEPYGIPLARIDRILEIAKEDLSTLEDKQFYTYEGEHLGVVDARQVIKAAPSDTTSPELRVVVISDRLNRYGLVVDRFLGQRELVVVPLDPRLGKVPNVSAGAILEDGSPTLILDAEDLVRSIDNLLTQGRLERVRGETGEESAGAKRILVVDDSLTVREVERRLLENSGYEVTVAVDGVDGWNLLQGESGFDLVISDVDMPRMNGIELVGKIRHDPRLRGLPIIIVSYKDREEDRLRGLEAGANYYLTKSSFHDEGLKNAVRDMIGDP